MSVYIYQLADTANSAVNLVTLQQEIEASDIDVALNYVGTPVALADGDIEVTFKAAISTAEELTLDTVIAEHTGEIVEPPPVIAQTAIVDPLGDEKTYATHNFCNPTTWYSESVRVVDEVLTSNNGTIWDVNTTSIISMTSGNVLAEEELIDEQKTHNPSDPHGYAVVVTVDDVLMIQRPSLQEEWDTTTPEDYYVDYAHKQIVFRQNQAGKVVKCSYSQPQSSGWIIQPLPGKQLIMKGSEIQFSSDIEMHSSIIMETFGYVDVFAPHLVGAIPSGTKIPIKKHVWKKMTQIEDEAVGAYPVIPAIGGPRGHAKSVFGFPFKYVTVKPLSYSAGMYVRIYMEKDVPFHGEKATATFYCKSEDE